MYIMWILRSPISTQLCSINKYPRLCREYFLYKDMQSYNVLLYDIIYNTCLHLITWGWKVDEVLLRHLVMHIEIVSSSSKGGHLAKTMTGAVAFSLPYIFFGSKKSSASTLCFWSIFPKSRARSNDSPFAVFKSFVHKLKINEFKKWKIYFNFILFSL